MPRNVVTVVPRLVPPLPSRRREQRRILTEISKRHRPTPRDHDKSVRLDFSKREAGLDARARVVGWLDEINPAWSRYVKVYPRAERRTSQGNTGARERTGV